MAVVVVEEEGFPRDTHTDKGGPFFPIHFCFQWLHKVGLSLSLSYQLVFLYLLFFYFFLSSGFFSTLSCSSPISTSVDCLRRAQVFIFTRFPPRERENEKREEKKRLDTIEEVF